MASREAQLLSRIIRTGDIYGALEWGISSADFTAAENRAIFEHLVAYHQQYKGSVVGPEAAKNIYPSFQLCDDPSMATAALCRETRNHRLAIEGQTRLKDVQALFAADPLRAVELLGTLSTDLSALAGSNNTDIRAGDAFTQIWNKYQLKKQGVSFSVCPWPWFPIELETSGIQPRDYIVFYGRPKSKKSWVLAYLIAWCYNKRRRAVIYTKEMGADDIFSRILACLAQVDARGLRLGHLEPYAEWSVSTAIRMMQAAHEDGYLICLSGQDCRDGEDTVPWLASKLEKYKPDLCFIDGMYLMSDVRRAKKDHEKVQNISRMLRQVTLNTNIPIIATVQANRKAAGHQEANLDELAFSDSIGQDATHIFRVINEKNTPTIALLTAGGREFNLSGWRIYGIPATNFGVYGDGTITAKEAEKAKENDVGDGDDPAHTQQVQTQHSQARRMQPQPAPPAQLPPGAAEQMVSPASSSQMPPPPEPRYNPTNYDISRVLRGWMNPP